MSAPTLRIVSINDVYSLAQLPRLATLIARARSEGPPLFMVVMAGDFLAPSTLSSIDAGASMIDCMNHLPVTHAILGNHEDDIAPAALRARIDEFSGTWISTNVTGLSPKTVPSQIVEIEGDGRSVRVGLVGVVMDDPTDYRDKPFLGATVTPANATATSAAQHLVHAERCDTVIALTHQSIALDRALAADPAAADIPLVLGGHEHVAFDETIGATRVLKAGMDATHAWIVDLTWSVGAKRPAITATLEPVAGYEEDEAMRARVAKHLELVDGLAHAVLLQIAPGERLSSIGSRRAETTLGTLLCSRIRDALGAEVALLNGGAIRASRDYERQFTYADLEAEVPFENEIVVVEMPGSVVVDAIRFSRRRAPAESGGFLHFDDRTSAAGAGPDVVTIAGEPVDLARAYRVAVVRNLLDGMDHIDPFVTWATENRSAIPALGSGRGAKMLLVEAFARALIDALGGPRELDENHDGTVVAQEIAHRLSLATREPASPITVDLLMRALAAK